MRSRRFSMVRVARIAGAAQAYAESSGNERLSLEPGPGHRAVRNQRRARQVAGILQYADEQEQQQHLWKKYHHRAHARPHPLHQQGSEHRIRQRGGQPMAGDFEKPAHALHQRNRRRENGLKHRHHHGHEHQRAGHGVQENAVQAVGPLGRRRSVVSRVPAHPAGPLAHLGTSCRTGNSLGEGLGMAPARKSNTCPMPSPCRALTSATGAPSFAASAPRPRVRRDCAGRPPCLE